MNINIFNKSRTIYHILQPIDFSSVFRQKGFRSLPYVKLSVFAFSNTFRNISREIHMLIGDHCHKTVDVNITFTGFYISFNVIMIGLALYFFKMYRA